MKEIWKKKKIFVITIALIVGIIGTAATFAIITATAGTVTNTFQVAKVATEIEEEFEGGIRAGSTVKKNPSVKNTGISDVFVRVRITVSPEQTEVMLLNGTAFSEKGKAVDGIATERTLYDPDSNGIGWYQGTDGWFYYNSPVAPGQNTENLFDAVKLGDVTKNFDITVYQEAVFAGSYEAGDKAELPVLKGFFAEVTK
jgi:alternate signal-mediated exported protein